MPSPLPLKKDPKLLTWAEACAAVLSGKRVTRAEWGDPTICVLLHGGALHLRKADASLHTLIVSDGDLAATDWTLVREI